MRVLLVNVAPALAEPIMHGVSAAGGLADRVANSRQSCQRLRKCRYDAAIIKLRPALPHALTAMRRLRRYAHDAGILALVPRALVPQSVGIVEQGANDWVAAPFPVDEVLTRLHALPLRRLPRSLL